MLSTNEKVNLSQEFNILVREVETNGNLLADTKDKQTSASGKLEAITFLAKYYEAYENDASLINQISQSHKSKEKGIYPHSRKRVSAGIKAFQNMNLYLTSNNTNSFIINSKNIQYTLELKSYIEQIEDYVLNRNDAPLLVTVSAIERHFRKSKTDALALGLEILGWTEAYAKSTNQVEYAIERGKAQLELVEKQKEKLSESELKNQFADLSETAKKNLFEFLQAQIKTETQHENVA